MPRYIDADELMRYTEGFNDALMRFRSMVHAAPTISPDEVRGVGKWISVTERLPEPYTDVLVHYNHGNRIAIDCIDSNGRWAMLDTTHWMPLPKPPKGVE